MTNPTASTNSPLPADRPTAAIIPFPARPKPSEPAPRHIADDRLAKALESLNAAMSDQRAAVAAWRAVLGELKATTSGLDQSLQRYRTNLRALSTSVSSLHAKARSPEDWADRAAVE
jgi:chromosome segregation ATPase